MKGGVTTITGILPHCRRVVDGEEDGNTVTRERRTMVGVDEPISKKKKTRQEFLACRKLRTHLRERERERGVKWSIERILLLLLSPCFLNAVMNDEFTTQGKAII